MKRIKLWLSVKEFAPYYGRTEKAIYEQIRTGGFPFDYRRTRGDSGLILISARDVGLVEQNETLDAEPTQPQDASAIA